MNKINKKILSEVIMYEGVVQMPEGFEIQKDEIVKHITAHQYYEDYKIPFCKEVSRIETYILDYLRAEYKLPFETGKKAIGYFYQSNERSKPQFDDNYSDYTCIYTVETDPNTCSIILDKENFNFKLETGNFIVFPSSLMYYIENVNNSYLNYIQKYYFRFP